MKLGSLAPDAAQSPEPDSIGPVTKHTEKWPNGKLKSEWGTARASDGRILLEGPQTFYFEDGTRQWTATFHLGRKIGEEIFYRADGSKRGRRLTVRTMRGPGNSSMPSENKPPNPTGAVRHSSTHHSRRHNERNA